MRAKMTHPARARKNALRAPDTYAEAGRVYKKVFDNDDEAKALGLSPVERMLYHRERSKPLMQELKKMCEEKIRAKLVEPNSRLWEPLTFVLNQWDRRTRFCEAPGVPLDTNLVYAARGINKVMPCPGLCRVEAPRFSLASGLQSRAAFADAA